jgi:hypothetical protein
LLIQAPWTPTQGAVAKRYLYRKIGGAVGITLADYSLDVVVSVAIPHEVPERIARSNIQENVVYHYAIVDEDAKGQRCSLSAPVSYQVNDLTAPTFPGLSLISNDPEALQTAIKLSFTGGKKEADDALLGGSRYVLYQGTGPGNACIAGSRVSTFDMQPFATGQNHVYTVRDLLPRTQYSFCLRTEDSAGNLSVNETSLSLWTLDTTPPAFDGGQDLVYSGSLGEFSVSWNSAEAQDIDHYDLYVWRNKNVPSQPDYFRLQRLAKDFPNGASFGRNEVPFQDEDTIYIKVVACDDADKVPGGISNCSSLQNSVTRSLQIPDVTPPPGFTGVLPASVFEKPGEGALLVKWNLPDNTADYRGFRVFHVNTSAGQRLELLKDCPCPAGSCSNFNSCLLEGLGAYRTYNVHVRAYDAHQNITNYLPAGLYSSVRTSDTTPPLFQSMLILSNKGADVKLSWRQAQDNQDSRDPSATLRYEIYRKLDQTFANQTQPESNLLIKTLDNETSFVDATRKLSGRTYYYTVCALDATSNRNCDGTVGNFAASDTRKPYLDFVDLLDDSGERSWKISWIMNDETTASVDLRVKIDSYYSPVEEFSLNADDYTIPVIFDFGKTSVSNLSPQMGYDGYIHYRISVADAAGNETVRYISRYVGDFRIEVHSVKRNRGLIAGGQTVLIRGYGFDIGSKVYFGNNLCLNTEVLDFDLISCKTPSNPASAVVDVKVVNSLGQSAILTRAFKYYIRVQTSSDHPCDAASKPTTSFQSGSGLESDPYLICTPDQLRLIGELGSATSHYRLGENLVLGNYNEIGGTSSAPWRGTFDADYLSLNTLNESRTIPSGYIEDFALSNLTLRLYRASAFIPGNRTTFKNLRVYGHNLYGGTFLYQFGPSEAVDIKNLRLRNAIVHSGSSNQYFTTFKLDSCSLRFDSSGGQTSLIGEEVRIENCSIVSRQSTASVSIGGSKTFMSNIFIDSNNNGGISLLSAGSIQSVFNGISVLARHNDCERSGAKPLSTGLIGTMDNISLVLRSYDKGACSAEYDNYGHFPNQIMRTSLIKANYVTNYRLFLSTSPSTSLENSIVKLSINAVDGGRMYSSFADCQNVLFEGQIFYDTNTKFAGLCRNVTDSLSNIGMNTPPLSIFSSMGSSSNIRGIYRGEVYQPTNVPGAFGSASSPNSYWDTDSTNIPASPGQIQGGGLQPADFANDAYFADYDFENIWQWNEDHTQPILRFKTWDFVNVWKKDPTGGVDHKLRMNSFDFVQTWRLGPGGELLLRHQDAPNVWP